MLLFGSLYYIPKKSAVGDILYYISYIHYTNIVIKKFEIVPFFGVGWNVTYEPKSIGLGLSSQFDGGCHISSTKW